MPRYHLHLRDGSSELLDPEGTEVPDLEALRHTVLTCVRDLISGDVRDGIIDLRYRVDAEDEAGGIAYSLPFNHAISIIPG